MALLEMMNESDPEEKPFLSGEGLANVRQYFGSSMTYEHAVMEAMARDPGKATEGFEDCISLNRQKRSYIFNTIRASGFEIPMAFEDKNGNSLMGVTCSTVGSPIDNKLGDPNIEVSYEEFKELCNLVFAEYEDTITESMLNELFKLLSDGSSSIKCADKDALATSIGCWVPFKSLNDVVAFNEKNNPNHEAVQALRCPDDRFWASDGSESVKRLLDKH